MGSDFIDTQWTLDPCRALRPGLEKPAWVSPLDPCECAVTGTSECSPALWCTDDLFFQKERGPGMTAWAEELTWSHSWVFFLFVPGDPPSAGQRATHGCLLNFTHSSPLPPPWNEVWHTARIPHSSCVSSRWSGGAGLKVFVHPENNSSTWDQVWTAPSVEMGRGSTEKWVQGEMVASSLCHPHRRHLVKCGLIYINDKAIV